MFASKISKLMVKVLFSLVISSAVLLSGCKSLDPYTGEEKVNSTFKYGAISAAICGAIGSRKSSKRARNAALGCGVIGASVGAYMDSQEKKLRQSLQNTGVSVKREGDQIRLIMPGNITFASSKSSVQQDFYPVLNSVVTVLREYDKTIVEVEGHTDSTGSWQYNMQLSQDRASQVAEYLRKGDIIEPRLIHIGKGPSIPIASNDTPQGRAQNRRVEIRLRAIETN